MKFNFYGFLDFFFQGGEQFIGSFGYVIEEDDWLSQNQGKYFVVQLLREFVWQEVVGQFGNKQVCDYFENCFCDQCLSCFMCSLFQY